MGKAVATVAEAAVGRVGEVVAATLVALEMLLLFAGVVARYVFNSPLTWSDELASTLFLWLAMMGAVIALHRGEHMRLTTVVHRMSPRAQLWANGFAQFAMLVFALEILRPALDYFDSQWDILTPALEWRDGWRVAALGVGTVMMLPMMACNVARLTGWRNFLLGLAVLIAAGIAATFGHSVFLHFGNVNLLIFFVGIVGACVLSGVPIAFAFGLATLSYLALATHTPLTIVVSRMDEGMSSLVLLSVPLFVFLGLLMEMTGLAAAMVSFLASLIGHIRGGLAYTLIGAMYLVSGISGSKAADMAAVAPALFPEMKRRGNNEGRLIALLSASGAMSETIPPSLVLITIGSVTGVSIASLFTGGLVPAAVGALALCIVVLVQSRREPAPASQGLRWARVARAFVAAMPALALPFVIRLAVVKGVATPTEVSTVGIAYACIVGAAVYRQFDWRRLYPMLVDTASLSGAILLIIGCATAMAWALTQSGFSRDLASAMQAVPYGADGFLAISVVAFVVLGSVLEGIPAIVLFGPLLFPIARALGIHDVHYAMVVIFAMGLGLFSPPFGVGFYSACAVGRVSPDSAVNHVWPYLGALLVALIAIAVFPWLSVGFL